MSRSKTQGAEDSKTRSLREHHALHPHPENIHDEAFQHHEFLDARDRVQVRYEMLRRHRVEGKPISEVAKSFGMSRQAFYVTDATFSEHGVPGLLPRRRGPKGAHKCTHEVLDFVEQWSPEGKETLVEAIRRRFSVTINPRSIERALARRKKKTNEEAGDAGMRSPLDPAYVLDQYEAMRRDALGADPYGPRGHGLVLLLSRGMPAWLAALSILDRRHACEHAVADLQLTGSPELAPAVRSDLTLVCAGMILTCSHETTR